MEIFLVRHTKVEIADGVCYGCSDLDLADSFQQELEMIRQKMPQLADYTFFSSPLKRCRQLSEGLTSHSIIFDDRLKEFNFGDLELKKWSEIDPAWLKNWMENFVDEPSPGGESFQQMYDRVIAAWQDIIQNSHDRIVIVCHAGVIRCIVSFLLEIPLKKIFTFTIDYGGMVKVDINNGLATVKYINR
ncbi:MAG: alpha-ribazole phosphatase [Candidatus Cyclobacteriaceae bacterium M3_2C_046]